MSWLASNQRARGCTDLWIPCCSRHHASEADDVVGRLLAGESEDRLSEQELFANIVLLLIAGHENSTSLIGNGAALLLGLPEVRAELARDPSRWPAAIEELMRLVSPYQFIRRQAREDSPSGTRPSGPATALLLILAAANRDPKRFQTLTGSCSTVHKPSRSVTGSTTASEHPWRGSKAASRSDRVREGGRPSAKPGSWCTPTTSTCGSSILSLSPHLERNAFASGKLTRGWRTSSAASRRAASRRPRPRQLRRFDATRGLPLTPKRLHRHRHRSTPRPPTDAAGVERKRLETLGIANAT